ncbi:MAG: hypothetical protein ACRBCJ_11185 [Hyphomicrobiaceae bacterium]
MKLIFQRSHRTSFGHPIVYILDVTIATTVEERCLIKDHHLGKTTLYAVPEIVTNQDRATTAFQRSDNRSCISSSDTPRLIADIVSALFHMMRANFGYRITVNDAISGTRVLCADLYELLDLETAITTNFDELDRDVQNALAFTIGREQILIPETNEELTTTPPAYWADHHRWRETPNG